MKTTRRQSLVFLPVFLHLHLHLMVIATGSSLLGCSTAPGTPPTAVTKAAADASAWRHEAPPLGATPELHLPTATKSSLSNGLAIYTIQKSGLPLVSVALVIRSGSAHDPVGAAGVAAFTADMLKMGTTRRSAAAIAEETEALGSSVEVGVEEDYLTVSTGALTENLPAVLDVLADMVLHPKFKKEEIERVRDQHLAAVAQSEEDPRAAAANVFRRVIYGSHPYGHSALGDAKSIKGMSLKQLQDYYGQNFRPANAAVLIAGDITPEAAQKQLDKLFGGWKGKAGVARPPVTPQERNAAVALVSRQGAPQSEVLIGELAVARTDPDYFPLLLCNAILGGQFNSRINMNLREDKGYTYGAHSSFDFMRERGPFMVATGVKTNVTGAAIVEVLKEIDKMRTADVTDVELRDAKSRYSLSLPGKFQTLDAIVANMANLYLYELPLDYFQSIPAKLGAVSIADVRRVAEKHLHPDKLSIVVVGDENEVQKGLADLQRGNVELLDAKGDPLAATKPQAAN